MQQCPPGSIFQCRSIPNIPFVVAPKAWITAMRPIGLSHRVRSSRFLFLLSWDLEEKRTGGGMPFTDYPFYMGIVTLLLAGMAFILKRSRYVVFFTILALVTLVISFGKHFPILYGPLFKFLPFFNKFRVPSMIHILLAFAVVILAGIGLHSLLNLKDQSQHQKIRKYIYIFIGISGFIALFLLFGKGVYLNWMDLRKI